MTFVILIVIAGIAACAASQVLLKKSAVKEHRSIFASILNWRMLLSYGILFSVMIINIWAYSCGMQMKEMVALESTSYIFVPLFSFIFLREMIGMREIAAIAMILAGIYVFYL